MKNFLKALVCDERGHPSLSDFMVVFYAVIFSLITFYQLYHFENYGKTWPSYETFAYVTVGGGAINKIGKRMTDNNYNRDREGDR